METWFTILICISIFALITVFLNLVRTSQKPSCKLPPGPPTIPFIGNIGFYGKSEAELERSLRSLYAKFGPIVTLYIGSRPVIFSSDRFFAHQTLVQRGAVFADRPKGLPIFTFLSCDHHNIASGFYGPTWRLLRRNLTSEILHPSRVKSYSHARRWVLKIMEEQLLSQLKSEGHVSAMKHFQYAIFCLLVLMCFGDKVDQKQIKEVEDVQRHLLLRLPHFNIFNLWPRVTKVVLRKRWQELIQIRGMQEKVLIPLIRARKSMKMEMLKDAKREKDEHVLAYVDTLFDLQLPEEKRNLEEKEIVSLCSEFLNGGTDSTSTALQWIMANLVKYQSIQEKLYAEIKSVVGHGAEYVKEDDLQRMPYLKAVVMESLRRHSPALALLPHAVTEDVVLNGFLVPKNAILNFMVAHTGWDSTVWEDPMAFRPERFLKSDENGGDAFDITGSREIKMMPFGAGRRICPGLGLAMLHLEFFVANLLWRFEWNSVDGDELDFSEKQEFTRVMKNPLKVHISPRFE